MREDGHANPTILIVEDSPLNMFLFQEILQQDGFNVIGVMTGNEAYKEAQEKHPHVILLDIGLPDISGVEVFKLLQGNEKTSDIPVIALTAYAMKYDQEDLISRGFKKYISKPIDITNFSQLVRDAVG